MYHRLEISPKPSEADPRGQRIREQARSFLELPVENVRSRDVYSLFTALSENTIKEAAEAFANPVIADSYLGESRPRYEFQWVVFVGFRPGVADTVARSAMAMLEDLQGTPLNETDAVYSSTEYFVHGSTLTREHVNQLASELLANELIQRVHVMSAYEWETDGAPVNCPAVEESASAEVNEVDLERDDNELMRLSREGCLALELHEMKAIQEYYRQHAEERKREGLPPCPTDVELESLAQTWSEHCKHKIFNARVLYEDENGNQEDIDSCFKTYIRSSTRELEEKLGWLQSVFHDNAGVIDFNDKYDLVFKVETHNSPTALDPYGGAITGIVGVNRDPLGTGKGANLLLNVWGYCFASPFTAREEVPEGLFHPRRLRAQVHKGVIDGGNQSGIPYAAGWEYFDSRYLGKPLVYCGTVGTLPKEIQGEPGYEKDIRPGDKVVMIGGRIGKDGIHGATFSSEALHSDSPNQAVQIGDPITQKLMTDFLMEARDLGLYRFITDNGAGGLSSSVGEMSETSDGCDIELAHAPLKYAGLQPWEILLSEAQERMSLAVPEECLDQFLELAKRREVEATVLGSFTDTGRFQVRYQGRIVASVHEDFLHNGLPQLYIPAKWTPPRLEEPTDPADKEPGDIICDLLARPNICSNERMCRQYDHEVKGLSVIKPFVGCDNDVTSDATVSMIEPLSSDGIAVSSGLAPRYSDIDTYHMMASVIDMAIRRNLSAGSDFKHIAGLDNFCWPDPVESENNPDGAYKMAQLVRANKALYHFTKHFGVPCISGKDSMKNDSTIGGQKISIPPTVLFSAVGRVPDINRSMTLGPKQAGDLVYVIGNTRDECGGSEYYNMYGCLGRNVPEVYENEAVEAFRAISDATAEGVCRSVHSPAFGGLGVAFAKMVMAGGYGMDVDLAALPSEGALSLNALLFSESNSRFVVTILPEQQKRFESICDNAVFAKVGTVKEMPALTLYNSETEISTVGNSQLKQAYKKTLDYA